MAIYIESLREDYRQGRIHDLYRCSTNDMAADELTKDMDSGLLQQIMSSGEWHLKEEYQIFSEAQASGVLSEDWEAALEGLSLFVRGCGGMCVLCLELAWDTVSSSDDEE